jgi:DNA topoisomerase-3
MGKTILQRTITRDQVVKIAETGKTDLIAGFVSKKGRKFAAYLKLDGKKVSFEFEPRAPKAAKSGKGEKEEGDSTVARTRFGKPVKPNLSTKAVTAKVEKVKKVKIKKPTVKKAGKTKKKAVTTGE